MKLINFKCPNCGAGLNLNEDEITICEFCGSELHFSKEIENLQKENKEELEGLGNRIIDLIEELNFIQAEETIKEALKKFPYAGRMYFYMLMCEFGIDHPDDFIDLEEDFTTSYNYINCLKYMVASDKEDLVTLVEMWKKNQNERKHEQKQERIEDSNETEKTEEDLEEKFEETVEIEEKFEETVEIEEKSGELKKEIIVQQNKQSGENKTIVEKGPFKIFAIIGMAIGFFSLVVCWIPFMSAFLSIYGIVFSALGTKSKRKKIFGFLGLAVSIFAFILNIILSIKNG